MNYTFSSKAKKFLGGLIIVGLLLTLLGYMTYEFDAAAEGAHVTWGSKMWSNLLANGFFFFGISLVALFFIAMQYAAEAAWATVLKRIFEGVSIWLPIGSLVVLVAVVIGSMGHFYHWAHYNHLGLNFGDVGFDHLLDKKSAFLNSGVVIGGVALFLALYNFYHRKFLKRTDEEDNEGGLDHHKKNIKTSAIFLVIFGFTSVVLIWMVLMSIDAHWFSTLYGWYVFAGMWISFITITYMIINYLKGQGALDFVHASHMHDMGKWMFALSFLWSYLFFCQFLLIWYSNIPEEVTYYLARIQDYPVLFWGIFVINMAFPMLLLMDKDAKVNKIVVTIVGLIIFFGHYLDTWLMITPGVMKQHGSFGMFEMGMFLLFLGAFLYVILSRISKKPLMVKNHPFLDESKNLGH
jgi:hypothetical protein